MLGVYSSGISGAHLVRTLSMRVLCAYSTDSVFVLEPSGDLCQLCLPEVSLEEVSSVHACSGAGCDVRRRCSVRKLQVSHRHI